MVLAQDLVGDLPGEVESARQAEVSEADRIAQLVAKNADNASSLRKMFVVNEVRVKNIRKEFPKREREVIREAVTLNQETVDELRNAVQSNSPVFRRASEQLVDVSKVIAAQTNEADVVLYVDE
ncbi:hypothetical protein G6N73_26560 [Mesorhizobium camelthorni]|uniref:Uncharacterized protein n=1 Tax=Allomesorhizobium camelthorni TaxID=475069 RepID=A0A6G4WKD3_9HYPH|nr:hypothetical protein [Mesorhizobium camelthorni]